MAAFSSFRGGGVRGGGYEITWLTCKGIRNKFTAGGHGFLEMEGGGGGADNCSRMFDLLLFLFLQLWHTARFAALRYVAYV